MVCETFTKLIAPVNEFYTQIESKIQNSLLTHQICFENTLWSKTATECAACMKQEFVDENVQHVLTGMHGEDLMILYAVLKKRTFKIKLSTPARQEIIEWLETHGAEYYLWCIMGETHLKQIEGCRWTQYIGEGNFAKSHLIYESKHKTPFVIKIQKSRSLRKERSWREIKILSSVRHKNVICAHAHGIVQKRVWILLEYANLGSLDRSINPNGGITFDGTQYGVLNCMYQISQGLAFLHNVNIIHRDIKCSNIFISGSINQVTYKIGDFDLAKPLNLDKSIAISWCGTPMYMAPEILSRMPYTHKADIWSMLCLFIHIVTGKSTNPITDDTQLVVNRFRYHVYEPSIEYVTTAITGMHIIDYTRRISSLECRDLLFTSLRHCDTAT